MCLVFNIGQKVLRSLNILTPLLVTDRSSTSHIEIKLKPMGLFPNSHCGLSRKVLDTLCLRLLTNPVYLETKCLTPCGGSIYQRIQS